MAGNTQQPKPGAGNVSPTVQTARTPAPKVPEPASKGGVPEGKKPRREAEPASENLLEGLANATRAAQDLSHEALLRDAPRIAVNGVEYPSVGGIPLLAKLGQGGMGAVYYGIHPRLQSEVAIKILPPHLVNDHPDLAKRFQREARLAARIESPHVCRVIDVDIDGELHYLLMEYVSGETSRTYLKMVKERGQAALSELEAVQIVAAATAGLAVAHRNGVVHRDIKPDNIMIPRALTPDRTFDFKNSKLMDLGVARAEGDRHADEISVLTRTQTSLGTPGYMAPEQVIDAKRAGKPSDVFSMGATLYTLLTGTQPFARETTMLTMMATINDPHKPLSRVRSDISSGLCALVDQCLAKKPEERFPDADALLRQMKECATSNSIFAGSAVQLGMPASPALDVGPPGGGIKIKVGREPGQPGAAPPPAAPAPVKSQQTIKVQINPQVGPGHRLAAHGSGRGLIFVGAAAAAALVLAALGFLALRKHKLSDDDKQFLARVTQKMQENSLDEGELDEAESKLSALLRKFPSEEASIKPPLDGIVKLKQPAEPGAVTRHAKLIGEARKSIEAADAEDAKWRLQLAKDLKVSGKNARQLEKAVADGIAALENRKKFDEKLKEVAGLEQSGDLQKAVEVLNTALSLLPGDDPEAKKADHKLTELRKNIAAAERQGKAKDKLAEARKLGNDKPEQAAGLVDEVLKEFPGTNDPLNQEAKKLALSLKEAATEMQRRKDCDKLIQEATQALEDKRYGDANKKALEAQNMLVAGKENEVTGLLAKIEPLLKDEEKKNAAEQIRKEREKKLAETLTAAEGQEAKGQLEEALATLKPVLAAAPEHEKATTIQKRVLAALEDRRKAEEQKEQKRKEKDFENSLSLATQLATGGSASDLDEADKNLAEARKLFPGDKDREDKLSAVQAKITARREEFKDKAAYSDLLTKVREALRTGKSQEAQQQLAQALKSPFRDNKVEDLKKRVEDLVKYDTSVAKGNEYATAAENLNADAYDEKITQYKLALAEYDKAKELAKELEGVAPTPPREAEVKQKLGKANTDKAELARQQELAKQKAEEEKKTKADAESAYGKMKGTVEALSLTSEVGVFTAAQRELNNYKASYKDDTRTPDLEKSFNQKKLDRVNALFEGLGLLLAKPGGEAEADGKLADAAKLQPDDARLKTAQEKLAAVKQYSALMQTGKTAEEKGQLPEAQQKYTDAAALLPKFGDAEKKAKEVADVLAASAAKKREADAAAKRKSDFSDLDKALLAKDAGKAQSLFNAFSQQYKDDPEIPNLRSRLDKIVEEAKPAPKPSEPKVVPPAAVEHDADLAALRSKVGLGGNAEHESAGEGREPASAKWSKKKYDEVLGMYENFVRKYPNDPQKGSLRDEIDKHKPRRSSEGQGGGSKGEGTE
ncbi:MAG: protein kinase [Planctomycetota bacterium]